MSKSRKEIRTEKLEGVQNSLKYLNQEISNLSDAGLDSNAKTAIDSGNEAIKSTTSLTKNMLDSFDKYLSDVTAAFKETDAKLAEVIGDPTPETNKDIKNSESYKKLMEHNTETKKTQVGTFRILDEQSRKKLHNMIQMLLNVDQLTIINKDLNCITRSSY